MLTREQLVALHRTLEHQQVLSVYLDGRVSDPPSRRAWHAWLMATLESVRSSLASDRRALHDFERCAEHLMTSLADTSGALHASGWVAFVTTDGIALAESVPVPMPNAIHFTRGAWVSPYLRAQKELRPVLLAVLDARSARLYRYSLGVLTPVETMHAHAHPPEPAHMGAAPHQGFHPGTRGTTGTDAAQAARREGTDRMLRHLAERLTQLAGEDAWVVIGGMPSASRAALTILPDELRARAKVIPGLSRITPAASLRRAAATGAMRLRREIDARIVDEILDRAGEHGHTSLGELETRSALALDGVHMLLITLALTEHKPDVAEEMSRLALGQHALVEIVAGDAADRLDATGGVGAILRYPIPSLRPATASAGSMAS